MEQAVDQKEKLAPNFACINIYKIASGAPWLVSRQISVSTYASSP